MDVTEFLSPLNHLFFHSLFSFPAIALPHSLHSAITHNAFYQFKPLTFQSLTVTDQHTKGRMLCTSNLGQKKVALLHFIDEDKQAWKGSM